MESSLDHPVPEDALARAAGFVGREWIIDAVDQWLAHEGERYLLIVGEPGWGKTALAAWLAGAGPVPANHDAAQRLARVRQGWDAVHFCVARGQRGTVNPGQFARDIAERLARHDEFALAVIDEVAPEVNIRQEARENWGTMIGARIDRLVVAQRDPEDVYNRAVRQPLKRLAATQPGLTVLILVDALDEALAVEGTNIVSLIAGSRDLPAGVRFVLTSRDEPRVLDEFDDARTLDLALPEYATSADADLSTYISGRLATEERLVALASDQPGELAAQLLRQADGNFLYTSWVLDEAAQGALPDFAALPKGLYGLYRQFLDRLVPQSGDAWMNRHEPFLGCLTVATPVAPDTSLPRWLGWPPGMLRRHVHDMAQVVEYVHDPREEEDGYRLYHRSVADFLTAYRYTDNGRSRPNEYYVEPFRQHDRLASYYLGKIRGDWAGDWSRSDSYGLRQLVSHLKARIGLAEDGRRPLIDDLYQIALDDRFHAAQREKLNGIHATLNDLRTALGVALTQNSGTDLLASLRCTAMFRGITAGESLSLAVFGAVAAGDFAQAAQKMSHYMTGSTSSGAWQQVLRLYLAWEAAESGEPQRAQELAPKSALLFLPGVTSLADALLTRTAAALARSEHDSHHWLAEFGRAADAAALLDACAVAAELPPDAVLPVMAEVEPLIIRLERATDEGAAYAISARMFVDEQPDALMDPETAADVASSLERGLRRIAANESGKELIVRALRPIFRNPYPRYRDIALGALGTAVLASPERQWVRQRMQAILRAGLDDEGITFTFDLPMIVLAECDARALSANGLRDYIQAVTGQEDAWGTQIRALSAQAAATYRYGAASDAFDLLLRASRARTTYAGYGVTAILALIDRCHEFGQPEMAERPLWGPDRNRSLPDIAAYLAGNVYDWVFRQERLELVELHRGWTREPEPDVGLAERRLSQMVDTDVRRAYQHHVAARWAASPIPEIARQVKALVPLALFDTTGLDAILARLVAVDLRALTEPDLRAVVELVTANFTAGRPWTHGQWR